MNYLLNVKYLGWTSISHAGRDLELDANPSTTPETLVLCNSLWDSLWKISTLTVTYLMAHAYNMTLQYFSRTMAHLQPYVSSHVIHTWNSSFHPALPSTQSAPALFATMDCVSHEKMDFVHMTESSAPWLVSQFMISWLHRFQIDSF